MIAVSPSSNSSVATPVNITVSPFPASGFGAGASIQSLKSSSPAAAHAAESRRPASATPARLIVFMGFLSPYYPFHAQRQSRDYHRGRRRHWPGFRIGDVGQGREDRRQRRGRFGVR